MGISSHHIRLKGEEHPNSHQLQIIAFIVFFPIWLLDSFIFRFSTGLAQYILWYIRMIFAILVIITAILLMRSAEKTLFDAHSEVSEKSKVIDSGVMRHVRHPLYLGVLLLYLGFVLGTFSIISFLVFIVNVIIYNILATYEEQDLERIFGAEYADYKNRVPKWIPRISISKISDSDE